MKMVNLRKMDAETEKRLCLETAEKIRKIPPTNLGTLLGTLGELHENLPEGEMKRFFNEIDSALPEITSVGDATEIKNGLERLAMAKKLLTENAPSALPSEIIEAFERVIDVTTDIVKGYLQIVKKKKVLEKKIEALFGKT